MVPLLVCIFTGWSGITLAVDVPRQVHPWGRFEPGAWKIMRATTESFEGGAQSVSITETRATLQEITAAGVTVRVEMLVEVAGKRFRPEPQTVRQGFHGELLTSDSKIKDLGSTEVIVQGRSITCQVLEVETVNAGVRTLSKITYSPTVAPYVIQRDSIRTELAGNRILESSHMEVTILDVPCRVGLRVLSAAQTRTVQTFPRGSVVTLSLVSGDVPGGVVCQTTKETDDTRKLVRRTTLELVDFGLRPGLRYSGGLRWRLLPREVYKLPQEWIQPGLLPETQGITWPAIQANEG
ncbi:MAG: hypothetical protein WBH86_09490 [Thermogutta sp.]|nr:hypothetical protein [Thermogutta sp.]HPU05980.1 hypothetical protein [Thermogutta sp.]